MRQSKKIKNKGAIIGLTVLIAMIVAGILLFPKFKLGALGMTTKVYQLNVDIPEKTQINENMVKETDYPNDFIPDKAILVKTPEEIVGSYSKFPMNKNDIITTDKITNVEDEALYSKNNLVSITMPTLASSVSSKLRAKDIVRVHAYIKVRDANGNETEEIISPDILSEMEVAYVLTSQAQETSSKEAKDKANTIASNVVLKTKNLEQVQELVYLENAGKIHLEKINK